MVHVHEVGDLAFRFFVVKVNKDGTEGRGPIIDYGSFLNIEDATAAAEGQAVMGQGDGDIYIRSYNYCLTCPEIVQTDEIIYVGDFYSKKHVVGRGLYKNFATDGWRSDYSPMMNDPEYAEFVRLKEKFEGDG